MASAMLPKGMQGLLETGNFSDLTVICGERTWKLHKAVICPQSSFFMKAFLGDYTEAKTNKIELRADDPAIVDAMIQLFYKQSYDAPSQESPEVSPASFHVQVHNIGDKYDSVPLQERATDYFKSIADKEVNIAGYAGMVNLAYSVGPTKSSLRSYAADLATKHAIALLVTESPTSKAFIATAADVPELGVGIACRLAREDSERKRPIAQSCHHRRDLPSKLTDRIARMESSRKRKALAATPASDGSASKKLKLLNSKHASAPTATPRSNVQELGAKLLEHLHRATDKTGRSIVTEFLSLPPRHELPDYYEFTKLPMALDTIQKKLQRNAYPTLTTLESDLKRLVQNAKDYNAPKSDIYEDADRVRKLVYNFMKVHNPQYTADPSYTSFPTPIPLENGAPVENGLHEDEDAEGEEPQARQSSERPKRSTAPQTSAASSDRKASVAPSATTGEGEDGGQTGGDLDFTGLAFQEAQQKMVSHLLHYTDEEGLEIYTPFGNLPTRKLEDYYKLIRHPVCLKSVQKRTLGQHGRAPPTGVSDFKTWDHYEEEMSFIWRNAQEYNEDGSDMYTLADELKIHFKALIAEAREKVDEPAGPRIKLGGPKPKVTLNLTQHRNSPTPGVTVDGDALHRQRQMVAAGVNGQQTNPRPALATNGAVRSSTHVPTIEPRPQSSAHNPSLQAAAVKAEKQSPALHHILPSAPALTNGMMPPPSMRPPSGSPFPSQAPNGHAYLVPASLPPAATRPYPSAQALLPTVTLATHPNLPLPTPFKTLIPAHPLLSHQSTTLTLPSSHYYLQISPTISKELSMGRPYKMFVSLNGGRLNQRDTQFHVETGRRTHVYEGSLAVGVNRVEVEVAAAGAGGGEGGEGLEVEKVTVFAHLTR
ncbi:hypothetical protein LTR08_004043 [Meristemomyces frigidus]|nr:hypothetical protein LTR08_004043 [Meristemomyces frigidus]